MKKVTILLITLMVISVGLLSGCTDRSSDYNYDTDDTYTPTPKFKIYNVKLEVSGTANKVDLRYTVAGNSYDIGTTYLPFTYEMIGFEGDWFYVSAQNDGEKYTYIEAIVYVDGIQVDYGYSSSEYGIASASVLL